MSTKKKQQEITVNVTTIGDQWPSDVVYGLLRDAAVVSDFEITQYGAIQDLPGLNRDRLIELATWVAGEHAKKELGLPSEWAQHAWLTRVDGFGVQVDGCGTACCVAGKVALDDGGVPVIAGGWGNATVGYDTSWVTFPGSDEEVAVRDHAQRALGLSREQANRLFESSNTADDILRIIGEILAADGPEPVKTRQVRRLKPGYTGDCGPECDICYEDVEVPVDELEPEPAPEAPTPELVTVRRRTQRWRLHNGEDMSDCSFCYKTAEVPTDEVRDTDIRVDEPALDV